MKPSATQDTNHREEAEGAGIAARLYAFDIADAVLGQGLPLDEAQARADAGRGPRSGAPGDPRDRAHGHMMVLTMLRRLGQIDAGLKRFLRRVPSGRGRPARTLMRLGAAQMMFLDTPPHAAISTLLTVADQRRLGSYKGLVNAVLRQFAEAVPHLQRTQDAARLDMPDWLWKALVAAHGKPLARAIAKAHLTPPPLDLTLRKDADPALADRLGARRVPTGSLRIDNAGPVPRLAGYGAGEWWVQDAAARLPAGLLIAALSKRGDAGPARVADLCAAPGGKTAQLCDAGFAVTAIDNSEARLERLAENMKRLGFDPETICADAETWRPPDPLDGVLLDAPCSATGTIRRHPELPWIRDASMVPDLQACQIRLIASAAAMVRPGGVIVYATCSLLPEEGEDAVRAALDSVPGLALDPIGPDEVKGLPEAVTADGMLRTLPSFWQHRAGARSGGMDGFFAARMTVGQG